MRDKHFYLSESAFGDGEYSTLTSRVMDAQETFILFLKDFDTDSFRTTLQDIVNDALDDGVCVSVGNSVTVERQENGYLISINFITSGVPPTPVLNWVDEFEIAWVDENGNAWTR